MSAKCYFHFRRQAIIHSLIEGKSSWLLNFLAAYAAPDIGNIAALFLHFTRLCTHLARVLTASRRYAAIQVHDCKSAAGARMWKWIWHVAVVVAAPGPTETWERDKWRDGRRRLSVRCPPTSTWILYPFVLSANRHPWHVLFSLPGLGSPFCCRCK